MDFLEPGAFSYSEEDILLSQALDTFENESFSTSYDDIQLSQALDSLEKSDLFVSDITDTQFENILNGHNASMGEFGDFSLELQLKDEPLDENNNDHLKRCFGSVESAEVDYLVSEQKAKNTTRSTRWAVSVFEAWRSEMKMRGEQIPEIHECDINNHLSRFIVEARKQDGSIYPPSSLYSIACGLLRHLRENGIHDRNFLDPNKIEYTRFREVLDAQMKKLTKEGLCLPNREAKPVTEEDESLLWKKNVFGNSTSLALQHTMYFYNCKFFGLRAYDEHKELMCNQFTIDIDENGLYVEFKGTNSKTFSGGLKHRKVDAKVIRHYDANSGIVEHYKDYLEALGNNGYFYRRPLVKLNDKVRYSEQPVGINKLRSFMKDMCSLAGLEGRYTNHSGKKTCATMLYQKGVPEEEIMKRTGHRSIAGVRKYQKPSGQMLKDISNKLNPKCGVNSEDKQHEETDNRAQSTKSSLTNDDTINNTNDSKEVKELNTTKTTKVHGNTSVIEELFARSNSFSGCTFNF